MDRAKLFTIMRSEIDDHQTPVRREDASGLRKHAFGMLRIMQHLMEYHRVEFLRAKWKGIEVAQHYVDVWGQAAHVPQLCPGKPQHFSAVIQRDKMVGLGSEQLHHPAGAGSNVQHFSNGRFAQYCRDGVLDF